MYFMATWVSLYEFQYYIYVASLNFTFIDLVWCLLYLKTKLNVADYF